MHPNPLRVERLFPMGDKTYILKPTFDALARIEGALGRSIFAALSDLSNPRTCRLSDIVTILECGIQAGLADPKNAPSRLEIGKHLQSVGIGKVLTSLTPWLSDAIATDEDLLIARSGEGTPAGEA